MASNDKCVAVITEAPTGVQHRQRWACRGHMYTSVAVYAMVVFSFMAPPMAVAAEEQQQPEQRPRAVGRGKTSSMSSTADAMARTMLEQLSLRLSLRDPTNLADEKRARPCDFLRGRATSIRLGCSGHPSWAVRHAPWAERNCRRRVGGDAHDRMFM